MSGGKLYVPVLATLLALVALAYYRVTPSIDDIWVLNLDRDVERFQKVINQQALLPQKVNRWKGTYGKDESRYDAEKDGVSHIFSKSGEAELNKRNPNVMNIPGEIGCWLSHKRLLRHLSTLNVSPNFGHLILEDDILIDKDFLRKWDSIKRTIPGDWDFIYLGIKLLTGDRINENVVRWSVPTEHYGGNYGTHAYIVRHGVIHEILEKLEFMNAAIDVQYSQILRNYKAYIVDPPLVLTDEGLVSTIDAQQKR